MINLDMKTVIHKAGILHVETPLGIINIQVGLHDSKGRNVELVSMLPDDDYARKPTVRVIGKRFVQNKHVYPRKTSRKRQ